LPKSASQFAWNRYLRAESEGTVIAVYYIPGKHSGCVAAAENHKPSLARIGEPAADLPRAGSLAADDAGLCTESPMRSAYCCAFAWMEEDRSPAIIDAHPGPTGHIPSQAGVTAHFVPDVAATTHLHNRPSRPLYLAFSCLLI
jgi:hypothetical protein